MTELLLIRHGETAWNAERRLQGHLDIPLNQTGLAQAQRLAAALRHQQIDAIIASDLQRALQTASAIAQWHPLKVQQYQGLRERHFGTFEGLLYSELEHRYPSAFQAWQQRDPDARFPSLTDDQQTSSATGESLRTFHQRCILSLRQLAQAHENKTIVVVAHGGVLECAYREAKQLPLATPRDFSIYNASINRFTIHAGQFQLQQWGDIQHLQDAKQTESSTAQLARDEI